MLFVTIASEEEGQALHGEADEEHLSANETWRAILKLDSELARPKSSR